MSNDELERALAEDSIEPSSGFTARVMARVDLAASEPPPLPFPWGRFAFGLVSCAVLATAGTGLTAEATTAWTAVATALSPLAAALRPLASAASQLGYATLGLVLSFALSRLPRLFIRS
jgi:hypothetical protein